MSNVINDDNVKSFIPKGFGFYIRPYHDKKQSPVAKKQSEVIDKQEKFRDVLNNYASRLHDFSEVLMSLLRYAKQVGAVARNTQNLRRIELYNAIRGVVESANSKRGKPLFELVVFLRGQTSDDIVEKNYPIWDLDQVRIINELEDVNDIAPKILCETVLQQIVNQWETHLADIIRIKYSADESLLTNPMELTFDQIYACGGIGSIKRLFVDKTVASAMKGGIEDHLRFFKEDKGFGINFQDCFPYVNMLKEVMFHRDVVVHCDGVASQRHCERMRGICKTEDVPKPGERIRTDLRYVFTAWDIVYAAGCVISYIVSKRFLDGIKLKDTRYGIEVDLVEASFNALKEERYAAVQMMIEPLLKCANTMDVKGKLALQVNLALAYKYSGQKKKYEEIIMDRDWDSREENYRAVIATLRGDFKTAYKLIQKICKDNPEYLNNVYEWVVYEDLRADKNFKEQMDRIKASKTYMPRKGNYPVLEFNAPPEDVGKHLESLFDSLLGKDEASAGLHKKRKKG